MTDTEFTYEKPDEQAFLATLIQYLKFKGEKEIADLLEDSKCKIESSGSFSYQRWNGRWTGITFYVPVHKLVLVNEEIKRKLREFCDEIIPAEVGFDVMEIQFTPRITATVNKKTLFEDLEEVSTKLSKEIISQLLPSDVKQKGKDMTETYLYLYCVENSLRLFVHKVASEKLGVDYFSKLVRNTSIDRKICDRKEAESKNKWLPLRGDSEIFYLDFKDLGTIIQNNWTTFSPYFPNQNWILAKIDELGDCRNLVAHNSYLQSHERDVIRVNYNSILKQIDAALKLAEKKK